jgi:hypothetical protein
MNQDDAPPFNGRIGRWLLQRPPIAPISLPSTFVLISEAASAQELKQSQQRCGGLPEVEMRRGLRVGSAFRSSDVIAAEVEEVIDLIIG